MTFFIFLSVAAILVEWLLLSICQAADPPSASTTAPRPFNISLGHIRLKSSAPVTEAPRPKSEEVSGRCETVNDTAASVCQPFRSLQTIFVDSRYRQLYVNQLMKSAFEQRLFEITEVRQCAVLLKKFLCTYVMPDCESDDLGRAIVPRLCRENCKEIFFPPHLCHKTFVALRKSSSLSAVFRDFHAVHFNFSDFSCPASSLARTRQSCYNVFLGKCFDESCAFVHFLRRFSHAVTTACHRKQLICHTVH